ncbi:hypothetical protein OROGR_033021 [Orobanche gracilis]
MTNTWAITEKERLESVEKTLAEMQITSEKRFSQLEQLLETLLKRADEASFSAPPPLPVPPPPVSPNPAAAAGSSAPSAAPTAPSPAFPGAIPTVFFSASPPLLVPPPLVAPNPAAAAGSELMKQMNQLAAAVMGHQSEDSSSRGSRFTGNSDGSFPLPGARPDPIFPVGYMVVKTRELPEFDGSDPLARLRSDAKHLNVLIGPPEDELDEQHLDTGQLVFPPVLLRVIEAVFNSQSLSQP